MELRDLHAEQYKSLRDEALKLVDETRKLENYAVGAVAVLYAWLVKDGKGLPHFAAWIATPIVVFAGLRSLGLYMRVRQIAEYLRKVEGVLFTGTKELPGWERWLAKTSKMPLLPTAIAFWVAILLVTAVAPWFLPAN